MLNKRHENVTTWLCTPRCRHARATHLCKSRLPHFRRKARHHQLLLIVRGVEKSVDGASRRSDRFFGQLAAIAHANDFRRRRFLGGKRRHALLRNRRARTAILAGIGTAAPSSATSRQCQSECRYQERRCLLIHTNLLMQQLLTKSNTRSKSITCGENCPNPLAYFLSCYFNATKSHLAFVHEHISFTPPSLAHAYPRSLRAKLRMRFPAILLIRCL